MAGPLSSLWRDLASDEVSCELHRVFPRGRGNVDFMVASLPLL
jgi:hypothetical protein